MDKFLLVNMATYAIASRHETHDAATAAHDAATHPAHVIELGGAWPEFTGVDLVKVFNALPGVTPVKRFESRTAAVRRLNEAILNPSAETPPPAPAVATTEEPKATQEKPTMTAKKTRRKRQTEDTDGDVTVALTATGKKDKLRFQSGSMRGKVHEAIKRNNSDGISMKELVKKCGFAKRAQVIGCVDKLILQGLVKRG